LQDRPLDQPRVACGEVADTWQRNELPTNDARSSSTAGSHAASESASSGTSRTLRGLHAPTVSDHALPGADGCQGGPVQYGHEGANSRARSVGGRHRDGDGGRCRVLDSTRCRTASTYLEKCERTATARPGLRRTAASRCPSRDPRARLWALRVVHDPHRRANDRGMSRDHDTSSLRFKEVHAPIDSTGLKDGWCRTRSGTVAR
jgi:hypothetical protein